MKRSFLVIAVAVVLVVLVLSVLFFVLNKSMIQTPPNIASSHSDLYWGAIRMGQSISTSVTLTNTGLQPAGPLNLTASNPVGDLTWDAENLILQPGESLTVNFTLTIGRGVTLGFFSFDIIVDY